MAEETPQIYTGKFVRKNNLLLDFLRSMEAEPPTPITSQLREQLAIAENCDFTQQLINSLSSTAENSLASYIRQYVRNNASDITELPAMERFYINAKEAALDHSAVSIQRVDVETLPAIAFSSTTTRPADFLATKNPAWKYAAGAFEFNRRATIQVNYSLRALLDIPGVSTEETIQWRFSDSGTNRIVTLTPTLHLEGSLTTGNTIAIPLLTAMFYPEHYHSKPRIPLDGSFTVTVGDNLATYGRIDRMRLSLQRSSWVARGPLGGYDSVLLPKTTIEQTEDTSNFLELIEL